MTYGGRYPDAFKPGGDERRATARPYCGQVLDPEEIQGNERTKEEGQSNAGAHRQKRKRQMVEWLENVQQSTGLLGDPG